MQRNRTGSHATRAFTITALTLAFAASAFGQPYVRTTGFEEYTLGAQVIWRPPGISGSTSGIVPGDDPFGNLINNAQVFECDGEFCLPSPAYEISFAWEDPTNSNGTAGVRCTTLSTPNLPSPSVHLAGKIRFKMAVTVFDFLGTNAIPPFGDQDVSGNPSVLMCLGIRETGNAFPLGDPDTGGGDLEYVYLPGSEVIPAAGTNGLVSFPPAGKRVHATTSFWPPQSGDFIQYEFDLADISTLGLVRGFANNADGVDTAGDGVLDATLNPNGHGVNRGVLESIIFTNDPNDTTGAYFFIYIDDVELISPEEDPVPPPTVVSPIIRDNTTVTVVDVSTSATEVRLIVDNGVDPDQTVDPAGATSVIFTLPHGAIPGDVYTATQTVGGQESSEGIGVPVTFPGPFVGLLPKDGDTTVRITGIDPGATEVELFVNANSRSVTVTSNGVFTIDVSAGGALVMGEQVTATQVVGGATSDLSPVAIVTTSGIETLFCDDFEYANQAAMNAVWAPTTGDLQLVLSADLNATPGGSKSALSGTVGDHRSGLINEFTPTAGSDTHPIIWNLSFYDEAFNTGLYRQYAEVRGALQGTSPLIALGKTNQIVGNFYSGRVLGQFTPTVGWFTLSGFNQPQRSNGWHVLTMAFKATTIDFYVDGALAATGIPHSSAQQIATVLIGSGLSSAGGAAYYDDVCIEVGALHFNTIAAQPPPPPTVVEPIVPGAATVTVVDVDTNATLVSLYRDTGSGFVLFDTEDPAGQDTVNFNVGSAVGGHIYAATQTVLGLESAQSAPVTVLLPGPIMYKAPAQGETSVRVLDVNTNATLVEIRVNGIVRGSINPAGASDVVVPLTAFSLTMGEEVTSRMTVDAVQSVDSAAETVTTNLVTDTLWCDNFESYADQTAFNGAYSPAGTAQQVSLSSDRNATLGGDQSAFGPAGGLYRSTPGTFTGILATDTHPAVFNVTIFDDAASAGTDQWASVINFTTFGGDDFFLAEIGIATTAFTSGPETHYQARLVGNGPFNWFQLDEFQGPTRSVGWHNFTMVFKGPAPGNTTGHEVDIYVDGLLARKNMALVDDTTLRTPFIGSAQNSDHVGYYDDYCVELGPVRFNEIEAQPPNKPVINAPVEFGDTTVTVSDVGPDATLVTVYANGSPIGSLADAGTNGVVEVPVTALVHLDAITADQTNASGTSLESDPLEVGKRNGDILISIGIRETNDLGPLGSQGATTGDIEWIGADAVTNGAPQGVPFTLWGKWQTIEFDPATDPITAFTGNGVIDGTTGTLEHLAVTVNAGSAGRSTGQYTMYVDNVINVGADVGDTDFVIADFEANSNGQEVLFQEPTNSGSTFPADLTPLPSASEVTSAQAATGERSAVLVWFWKDTTAERWARITTSATEFVSRPIIDISKPIRMDILLAPSCMTTPGDVDGDGDVDLNDLDEFAVCLEGPAEGFDFDCECADLNGDIHVDLRDYAALQLLLGN